MNILWRMAIAALRIVWRLWLVNCRPSFFHLSPCLFIPIPFFHPLPQPPPARGGGKADHSTPAGESDCASEPVGGVDAHIKVVLTHT